jgi:DNA-binding NtrC family response regulator
VVGESNFLTSRLLLSALHSAGHNAVAGRNGDEIAALIAKYDVSVLVLNLNLARPGGLEFLRQLQVQHPQIRVAAATATGQSDLKLAAAALGVSMFFELPFCPTQLTGNIDRLASTP